MKIKDILSHAWNAFSRDPTNQWGPTGPGASHADRPDRPFIRGGDQRSRAVPVINHIAIDCSSLQLRHCRVDQNESYLEEISSGLNYCLKFSSNVDQAYDLFIRDCVTTMCEEGVVAIVPVDTTENPEAQWFDIKTLRAGRINQWYPEHVQVELYNEKTGRPEFVVCSKKYTAIVENPLYAVMNAPNATAKRLIGKTSAVDIIDSKSATDKLNIIFHVPYAITNDKQQAMAERRRAAIEKQISDSRYGIAYADGNEKITQLNRAADNTMREEVKYLDTRLLNEYGMTEGILNGTATEEEQLNYYNRTVQPIMTALCAEMTRKYLSKTALTQGHRVRWFKDPFKLVPVNHLADVVDKFSRNEILSGNEIRAFFGIKPSDQPSADELRNKNIAKPKDEQSLEGSEGTVEPIQNDSKKVKDRKGARK